MGSAGPAAAVINHYRRAIEHEMAGQLQLFKSFELFHPTQFRALAAQQGGIIGEIGNRIDALRGGRVKPVSDTMLDTLVNELPTYLDIAGEMEGRMNLADDQPAELWEVWKTLGKEKVPGWYAVACKAVLFQPSSALVERFFSKLKGNTTGRQAAEGRDIMELRALCEWNCPRMDSD